MMGELPLLFEKGEQVPLHNSIMGNFRNAGEP